MELALIIYLIGLLDIFTIVKSIMLVGMFIVVLALIIGVVMGEIEDIKDTYGKHVKPWQKPFLILFVALIFIPEEPTAEKMLVAYAGYEVLQMDKTKEVGSKAYEALNKVLDDYLKEESQK